LRVHVYRKNVLDDDENILFNDSKDSQRPKQARKQEKKAQF